MVRTRASRRNRDIENEPGNFALPIFSAPPGGMEPINNTGFYRTPSEPADPQDCERYPDSPWCGGNPFTPTAFGLEPSIVLTECDIGIRFDGSFGFIRMPPVSFTYRHPNCRQVEPEEMEEVPQENVPSLYLPNIPDNEIVFVFLDWQQTVAANTLNEYFYRQPYESYEFSHTRNTSYTWSEYICPGRDEILISPDGEYSLITPTLISGKGTVSQSSSSLRVNTRDNDVQQNDYSHSATQFVDRNYFHELSIAGGYIPHKERVAQGLVNAETYSFSNLDQLKFNDVSLYNYSFWTLPGTPPTILHGKWGKIVEKIHEFNRNGNISINSSSGEGGERSSTFISAGTSISIAKILFSNCQTSLPISPPPLLPEPPMTCCPDDLIRLLIQKIDRLSEVVGINEYPATVPESFITRRDGFLNNLVSPPTTEVTNLTQFVENYINCFSELMGQWEIPIEVEDDNDTISVRQGSEIRLPSVAEAIGKMLLLALQTSTDSKTLPNISNQISSLSTKTTAASVESSTEYLYNQTISLSSKTAVAEKAEVLGQEHLHNQMVSLSAKNAAITSIETSADYSYNQIISLSAKAGATIDFESPEVGSTEYLHNQMVSLSAKTHANTSPGAAGQKYLHNRLVSLSAKVGATTLPGAVGQEYLHNQMVSLSAKTHANTSPGAAGQEYLHNRLVSLSAKVGATTLPGAVGQEYLHNQMVSLSAKSGIATSLGAIGQEYLHNQMVSLSAKSGATTSLGAVGQEYLHNQMVSLSAKATKADWLTIETKYLNNKLISLLAKNKTVDSPSAVGIEYLYNQSISLSIKNYSTDINKLLQITGINDFPITVPETLISKFAENSTNLAPVKEKQLSSIPQMFHWYVERFDEVMGQWSVPIEIKDIDPTTPGDQSKLMVFPNMAELLAEMMLIMFQVSINSELLTNISTRLLMEAGQDKQQNLITYKLLQSLTDYVGYSYKDEIVEMPLLFDPKAKSFDQMLTEVQIKVPVPEFDEKFNLQAALMRFNKAAAILESNYFRKIDPNGDIKAQLMKRLFDLREFLKEANKEDESFKEFLKQVEAGFTGTPGVGDPTRPYGDDYEDRPRFKDFNSEGIPDDI